MSFLRRIIDPQAALETRSAVRKAANSLLDWALEHAPVFGRAETRRRQRIVLTPYRRQHTLHGPLLKTVLTLVLLVSCSVYGLMFGFMAPAFMVPFVVPILVALILVLWVLPEQHNPPLFAIEYLFPLFFIVLILWPNYVAISLPGVPWITLLRLIAYPMTLIFLYDISVSRKFRVEINKSINSIPILWALLIAFITVACATMFLSHAPFASFQIVLTQIINWILIFVISATIFKNFTLIERYLGLLCFLSVAMILLVFFENHLKYIPWAAHIPKLLTVNAPSVTVTLTPWYRAYSNIYRAKGTFSTPLELAEFLSLLTPAFLYFGFTSTRWLTRIGSLTMIPILFIAIRITDSRLGVVGMLVSVLLYGAFWTIVRWRSRPGDLFAAAAVYGYPVIFAGAIAAAFTSKRLNQMIFGGELQAGSTAARKDQLNTALAVMAKAPWGHGAGQSGPAMGYSEGQFVTVDNYFITLGLDYGVLGIIIWYSIFIIAIFYALMYSVSAKYSSRKEGRLLAPLAVTLIAFLVIKWVHGQDENHPIYFLILGMISAVIFRLRNSPPDTTAGH